MTLATLLRASSIASFVVGALLLVLPSLAISGIYGMRRDRPTEFVARLAASR